MIIGRLSVYGSLLTFWRDFITESILNRVHTARMEVKPYTVRITGEFIRFWYPGQPKTCRCCGHLGHLINKVVEAMNMGVSRVSMMAGVLPMIGTLRMIWIVRLKENVTSIETGVVITRTSTHIMSTIMYRVTMIGNKDVEVRRGLVNIQIRNVGLRYKLKVVEISFITRFSYLQVFFFTLKVQGLVTPTKQDLVLNELSHLGLDTVYLQETHVLKKSQVDETAW